MQAPKNLLVDHINHDGLNNTRKNLRLATHAQNKRNQRSFKPASSKYKGVYYAKQEKAYRADIQYNGKKIFLGRFKKETDAAKAYDKKAKELFAEFACLNFQK